MAITTDSMVAVSSGGVNYDFYGLSKTLNNYTFDDIWNYVFCSASSNMIYHVAYGGNNMTFYTYQGADNFVPFQLTYAPVNHNYMHYHPDQVMNNPDGLYMKMIWLQRISSGSERFITKNNSYYKLITEFNAPHYVFECTTPEKVNNYYGSTSWTEGSYLYYSRGGSLYYYDDVTSETPVRINIPNVIPALIFKDENGKGFIISYDQINTARFVTKYNTINTGGTPITAATLLDWDETQYISFSTVTPLMYEYLNDVTGELTYPYSDGSYLPESNSIYPKATYGLSTIEHIIYIFACDGTSSYYPLGFEQQGYFRTSQECKKFFSLAGLHFKADKIYKPIIVDGYVTGFTDELSTTSDLDDWDGKTKHDVPVTPPSPTPPTPSGDDYSDMELGLYDTSLGGLTKYAILSHNELIALISDYNTNAANAGSNFNNHIISLYRLGIAASYLATTTTDNIVMIKSAGEVDFTSQATYTLVTGQEPYIDLGSITVPRMTGTFYDFSPYTSYELYIPGCGWIPLPDNVAGRTISAYLIFDLATCSAKGIVRIGASLLGYGTTIATVNGIIGASIPFTIGENGQQRAAVMAANAQVASGIATGIVGGALANPYMAVSGGSNLLGGLINAYTAGNTNYVSTKGGAADFSMFGDGGTAILKINAPEIDSVVNDLNFGHSVGYMCNEIGTLNGFHGFTVCSNPHVHINATSSEREEIKMLLEQGVILPNGE